MRYYLDTEFFEHPGEITLISIGLVNQNGDEFYAENINFDWDGIESLAHHPVPEISETPNWLLDNVKPHLRGPAMHVNDIRDGITQFIKPDDRPEFWGYFADYDWVVFCWLFGRMIDLPRHFPKYCLDIKQEMRRLRLTRPEMPNIDDGIEHDALADARLHKRMHEYCITTERRRMDRSYDPVLR